MICCTNRNTKKCASSKIYQIGVKAVAEPGETAIGTKADKMPGETRISPAPHKIIIYVRLYEITTPFFEGEDEEHEPLLIVLDN